MSTLRFWKRRGSNGCCTDERDPLVDTDQGESLQPLKQSEKRRRRAGSEESVLGGNDGGVDATGKKPIGTTLHRLLHRGTNDTAPDHLSGKAAALMPAAEAACNRVGEQEPGKRCGGLYELPPEVIAIVLNHGFRTPEARFVAAHVCRLWRGTICASDKARGLVMMRRGAILCCIRLADSALEADDAAMLGWVLNAHEHCSCGDSAHKQCFGIPENALSRFWTYAIRFDKRHCINVLYTHTKWPIVCYKRCPCVDDPCWNLSSPPDRVALAEGKANVSCRRIRLLLCASLNDDPHMETLMIEWGACHPARWVMPALMQAIEKDKMASAKRIWKYHGLRPYVVLDECIAAAIKHTRLSFFVWLSGKIARCIAQKHRDGAHGPIDKGRPAHDAAAIRKSLAYQAMKKPTDIDMEARLVTAAKEGATTIVRWLCEHQYVTQYPASLYGACVAGKLGTAVALESYVGVFCLYTHSRDCVPHIVLTSVAKAPIGDPALKIAWDRVVAASKAPPQRQHPKPKLAPFDGQRWSALPHAADDAALETPKSTTAAVQSKSGARG